jgi:hypothetical protein
MSMSDPVSRRFSMLSLVALSVLLNGAPAAAERACRPKLTVKEQGFSQTLNARRTWTASIDVDASHCTTTSGQFSIRFIRLAENEPDLTFTEPLTWRLGQKSVAVEFSANEAVERYWVEEVAACPCRHD